VTCLFFEHWSATCQPILILVQDAQLLGSIRGHLVALKLPIQKETVRWLLAWRPHLPLLSQTKLHYLGSTLTIYPFQRMWVYDVEFF
jgi:hypothetical protein